MERDDFEKFLDVLSQHLKAIATIEPFSTASSFETAIRKYINSQTDLVSVTETPHPYAFPDISMPPFGIEVKFTVNDSWRSVANSVFESTRDAAVRDIYVVFGKMGGSPDVKFARYEDCVMHVRTSHVPRFELEIGTTTPIFEKFGVNYAEFSSMPLSEKMTYVREYARKRLKTGERLWWLEDTAEPEHSLSMEVRLFVNLDQAEKRKLRAEAAILSPKIVRPSGARGKYNDVAIYLLTYHGMLAFQTRDLFTAGSVSNWSDPNQSGNYLPRSLADIETEMRNAAEYLDDALFIEYWGESCAPQNRIARWLDLADSEAKDWKPSDILFKDKLS
jgi:hypothetical protein